MNVLLIDAFSSNPFRGNPAGVCLLASDEYSDFPAEPAKEIRISDAVLEAIGLNPKFTGANRMDTLVELSSEAEVRSFKPNLAAIADMEGRGLIVTAKSDSLNETADFVSRFFAPAAGISEDPVTGSAHCCLAPYWAEKLGKKNLTGYQASKRGGYVQVKNAADRVHLGGEAVTVLAGKILV